MKGFTVYMASLDINSHLEIFAVNLALYDAWRRTTLVRAQALVGGKNKEESTTGSVVNFTDNSPVRHKDSIGEVLE